MPATSIRLPLARDVQASTELRSEVHLVRIPALIGLIAAVGILVIAAGPNVNRPGFSSDEEITALAVGGAPRRLAGSAPG